METFPFVAVSYRVLDDKTLSKKIVWGPEYVARKTASSRPVFTRMLECLRYKQFPALLGWWEVEVMRRGGAPMWVLLAQEDHPEKQLHWWTPNPT